MKIKCFATFRSGQLKDFNVNPRDIMLYIPFASEGELRFKLNTKDIKFCNTFFVSQAPRMEKQFGMYPISYNDLMLKRLVK